MKKVFVCSPLRGNQRQNEINAEMYCKFVINNGHAPFAPHLFYTRFLNDDIDAERRAGIEASMKFLGCCDEMWVFGNKITQGMKAEIDYCKMNNIPVSYVDVEEENGEFYYLIKGEE